MKKVVLSGINAAARDYIYAVKKDRNFKIFYSAVYNSVYVVMYIFDDHEWIDRAAAAA